MAAQDPFANEKQFIINYCTTFDQQRDKVYTSYNRDSTLTFEGMEIRGPTNIGAKLRNLPFPGIFRHHIHCIYCQSLPARAAGVVAFVTGEFLFAGQTVTLKFTQVFHLKPKNRTFYALNHIFRLHYA